jgi:hypothetical protein
MKDLVDRMHNEIKRLRNHDWVGIEHQRALFRGAIAALEAAEARELVLRAEKDALLSFNDTADKEIYVLRARVAELEGSTRPYGPTKHHNACLVCGNIYGHGGLQCPSYQVMMESMATCPGTSSL